MLPGPVFAVEMLTTARRARYYALRALYGSALLLVLWTSYRSFIEIYGRDDTVYQPGVISRFAWDTFVYFAIAQGVAVLAITPSLVGGTIAGEKQRKTLHYLLASDLTSPEIVLGKLMARMLMVFVYILAGVPFLFLLRLFGGVPADMIFLTFGVTIAFAFFLACVAIFFSSMMRQARSAIAVTYATVAAMLVAPLFAELLIVLYPGSQGAVRAVTEWVNPVPNVGEIYVLAVRGFYADPLLRMVVTQGVYSVALLFVATWRLRAVAASQADAKPKAMLRIDNRGRASWRVLSKPPIGDDPMLWKERYTSRVGGVAKVLGLLNNLFWSVLVGCILFEYVQVAVKSFLRPGFYFGGGGYDQTEFLSVLRQLTPWVAGLWILGTAAAAAGSIASEREDDTWTSLTATDLEGHEILRAKMIGAVLRFRWLGLLLLTTWALGVFAGAVHWLSCLGALVELAVYLWFAAALGVRSSLVSSSTGKALGITMAWLLFLNGGCLLCCLPLSGFDDLATSSVMPWMLRQSLYQGWDLNNFRTDVVTQGGMALVAWRRWPIIPPMAGTLFYALGALAVTWRAFARFDEVAGRPTLGHDPEAEGPAS